MELSAWERFTFWIKDSFYTWQYDPQADASVRELDILPNFDEFGLTDLLKVSVLGYLGLAIYSEVKSPTKKSRSYSYRQRGFSIKKDKRGRRSYSFR